MPIPGEDSFWGKISPSRKRAFSGAARTILFVRQALCKYASFILLSKLPRACLELAPTSMLGAWYLLVPFILCSPFGWKCSHLLSHLSQDVQRVSISFSQCTSLSALQRKVRRPQLPKLLARVFVPQCLPGRLPIAFSQFNSFFPSLFFLYP